MITLMISKTPSAARQPATEEQPVAHRSTPCLPPGSFWVSGSESFATLAEVAQAVGAGVFSCGLESVAVKKVRFCSVEQRRHVYVAGTVLWRRVATICGIVALLATSALLQGQLAGLAAWLGALIAWGSTIGASVETGRLLMAASRCTAPGYAVVEEGRLEKKATSPLFDEYVYRAVTVTAACPLPVTIPRFKPSVHRVRNHFAGAI